MHSEPVALSLHNVVNGIVDENIKQERESPQNSSLSYRWLISSSRHVLLVEDAIARWNLMESDLHTVYKMQAISSTTFLAACETYQVQESTSLPCFSYQS